MARPNRRLSMTLRQTAIAAAALAIALHLAGCDRQASAPTAPPSTSPPTALPVVPAAHPAPAPLEPAPSAAPAPATFAAQPSADSVLRGWAAAIERRDWPAVRALWGNHGADSGIDARTFAARWGRLHHPQVTLGTGDEEGGAGSIYYTAPVTVRDGARTITGDVTLRRVNDVEGATAEQLRWHLDAGTREPWTKP